MKTLKIAVLPLILLSLLTMGGCATVAPETTITGFQKVSSPENKKVHLSLPVVVEKDMETKKNPDATEREVANEMYNELKKNLVGKGIYADRDDVPFKLELRVHYVSRLLAEWEYFGSRMLTDNRVMGGKIVVTEVWLKEKKGGGMVAKINTINNTGTASDFRPIIQGTAVELANQIEKILKEGVSVGKSP